MEASFDDVDELGDGGPEEGDRSLRRRGNGEAERERAMGVSPFSDDSDDSFPILVLLVFN